MDSKLLKYSLFYSVRFLTGQKVWVYLKEFQKYDRMSGDELLIFQWEKFRKALLFAYKYIPYYKSIFESNKLHPYDITDPGDIASIPVLHKQQVQNEKIKLLNPNVRLHFKRSTSGSTGNPIQFYKDPIALAAMDASMYYGYKWHGIAPGDPSARFWGMPLDAKNRQINIVKDLFMNRVRLSAFEFNKKNLDAFIKNLIRIKPKFFYGYTSLIYEFALFCEENDINLDFLRLKAIIGTGELIVKKQIEKIISIFNAPFINEYGCSEMGAIGIDCPAGNMHLLSTNVYMEVVKDGKQVYGSEGDIIITELNFRSFPFIRYSLNDIGVMDLKQCSCGLKLPVIRISKGRSDSYIVTPKGKRIYDAILAYTLKDGIRAFKAIQKELNLIVIFIVPDESFSFNLKQFYVRKLKERIDPEINFNIQVVDRLPRESSGKMRYFIPLQR